MTKKKWSDVKAGTAGGFVTEEGIYTFLAMSAWDSLCALKGTGDLEKGGGKHYIGILSKVVGPEGNPQMGNLFTVRLWCHTENSQEMTKGVFERMALVFNDDLGPDDPMSVSEIAGQYFNMTIESEPSRSDSSKNVLVVKPWNIVAPSSPFGNSQREMFKDTENEMSTKHYQAELDKKNKSSSDGDDDDLPF